MKLVMLLDDDMRVLSQDLRHAVDNDGYDDQWRRMAGRVVAALDEAQDIAEPRDKPEPDLVLEHPVEIQDGKNYLLQATEPLSAEAAGQVYAKLADKFPNSTFGILSHTLKLVHAVPSPEAPLDLVTRAELVAAVERARGEAKDAWFKATVGDSRASAFGAVMALEWLGRTLTQTGDGAATPPASPKTTPVAPGGEQAAASATGDSTTGAAPSPMLPQCDHWASSDNKNGRCILVANDGHDFHQDSYGNRWNW